jgi:hypothetical protein
MYGGNGSRLDFGVAGLRADFARPQLALSIRGRKAAVRKEEKRRKKGGRREEERRKNGSKNGHVKARRRASKGRVIIRGAAMLQCRPSPGASRSKKHGTRSPKKEPLAREGWGGSRVAARNWAPRKGPAPSFIFLVRGLPPLPMSRFCAADRRPATRQSAIIIQVRVPAALRASRCETPPNVTGRVYFDLLEIQGIQGRSGARARAYASEGMAENQFGAAAATAAAAAALKI